MVFFGGGNVPGEEGPVKKVLVVDDQLTVRRLLEIALQSSTVQILLADSGEAALQAARLHVPDLVIMDVMMPGGMDGIDTLRALRSHPETSTCPIIMLTAKDQALERLRAEQAGADDYIAKPFRVNDLVARVKAFLEPMPSTG